MSQTVSFTEQLSWLRWLLSHANELPQLLNAYSDFRSATTVRNKWEAVKKAGDLLDAILDDAPLTASASLAHSADAAEPKADLSPAEFHARVNDLAISASFDGERAKKLLALISELLPLLLKLLGR